MLISYASLWEVELMETFLLCTRSTLVFIVRFPLGSGINGNYGVDKPPITLAEKPVYASLWEVELMETRS